MTRDEFEEFMKGEQWTAEKAAGFARCTPTCSADYVRHEMCRSDGIIEVRLIRRPFFKRFCNSYRVYRNVGLSRVVAAWYALQLSWLI